MVVCFNTEHGLRMVGVKADVSFVEDIDLVIDFGILFISAIVGLGVLVLVTVCVFSVLRIIDACLDGVLVRFRKGLPNADVFCGSIE